MRLNRSKILRYVRCCHRETIVSSVSSSCSSGAMTRIWAPPTLYMLRRNTPSRMKDFNLFIFQLNILLPIFFCVVCVFILILSFYSAPVETIIGTVLTLSGIPVYFIFVHLEPRHPKWLNKIKCKYQLMSVYFWISMYL